MTFNEFRKHVQAQREQGVERFLIPVYKRLSADLLDVDLLDAPGREAQAIGGPDRPVTDPQAVSRIPLEEEKGNEQEHRYQGERDANENPQSEPNQESQRYESGSGCVIHLGRDSRPLRVV